MVKSLFLCLLFSSHFLPLLGQEDLDENAWRHGVLILEDGQYLKGKLWYDSHQEQVLLQQEYQQQAFDAGQIRYFQFYDEQLKNNRIFLVQSSTLNKKEIYEVVLRGKLSLFRKSRPKEELYIERKGSDVQYSQHKTFDHTYYIKNGENNTIAPIKNFKKDALPLMKDHIQKVSQFIISHKLELLSDKDQIVLIDYYNGLD